MLVYDEVWEIMQNTMPNNPLEVWHTNLRNFSFGKFEKSSKLKKTMLLNQTQNLEHIPFSV
jgi:hypothetical protein